MFLTMINQFFIFNLMVSVIVGSSSNSWSVLWLMLELNLMVFVPLLMLGSNSMTLLNPIKYFLIQSMGSIIMLISFIFMMIKSYNYSLMAMSTLLLSSMAVKSGVPPFHFWFPQLLETTSWIQATLLLTLQKVIPFLVMTYCLSDLLLFLILTSGVVGATGGFNQNSMMKIIGYSSMVHNSWVMASILISKFMVIAYFLIYCLLTLIMMMTVNVMLIKKISDQSNIVGTPTNKFLFCINLMSLGGMPPLLGFFNKMAVIMSSINVKLLMLMYVLLLFSLISLVFYIRVCFVMLTKYFFSLKEKYVYYSMNAMSLLFTSMFLNILLSPMVFTVT